MFAGSGYGAFFEEMLAAESDGQLAIVDRGSATYLTITPKGAAAQKENDHGSK